MVLTNVIDAVKLALEKISLDYVRLSQKNYSEVAGDTPFQESCSKEKILERPFAYEFYHKFRSLMDSGIVNLGDLVIQAEIDKTYQHCFENNRGKIPDFLIHLPNHNRNLAVIEFKLTSNLDNVKSDFRKLVEFKKNIRLQYDYGVEVIIGDTKSIEQAKFKVKELSTSEGEELKIVYFNTESGKASSSSIKFKAF